MMFKNSNSKFLKERNRQEQEVKDNLKVLIEVSSDMLSDSRYKRIKEIFEEAERNTTDLILNYNELDPVKYRNKLIEFVTELKVFRKLLQIPVEFIEQNNKHKASLDFTAINRFINKYKRDIGAG